jgi:ParB-like chromosome segregation protein Spo0J
MSTMPITDIKVGKRHRRDMGDIKAFATNVREIGILQPVVVTPPGKLIAGERRLLAAKEAGLCDVPVHVVDIDAIARGELAENTYRKDFTPSEMVAIAATVEEQERKLAKARQLGALKRGDQKPVVEKTGGKPATRSPPRSASRAGLSKKRAPSWRPQSASRNGLARWSKSWIAPARSMPRTARCAGSKTRSESSASRLSPANSAP